MAEFEVRNRKLKYVDIGEGPVVLLGHAFLWDSIMFASQIEGLSQEYRCIIPDLWAHGQSDLFPHHTESLWDIAKDLLALLEHLEVHKFNLIGISISAMIIERMAILAPNKVKSMTMMGALVAFDKEKLRKFHAAGMASIDAASDSNTNDAVIKLEENLVKLGEHQFSAKSVKNMPHLVNMYINKLKSFDGEHRENLEEYCAMQSDRDYVLPELAALSIPTLVMVGKEDFAYQGDAMKNMCAILAHSEFIEVKDAGAILVLEKSEAVTKKLLEFLKKNN
jgi:pimeloyl-ACP methyl ester carboxylesterase